MRTVVKILMEFEVLDDPAARMRFRQICETLEPAIPSEWRIRDFKMVQDGTGRLLAKSERSEE